MLLAAPAAPADITGGHQRRELELPCRRAAALGAAEPPGQLLHLKPTCQDADFFEKTFRDNLDNQTGLRPSGLGIQNILFFPLPAIPPNICLAKGSAEFTCVWVSTHVWGCRAHEAQPAPSAGKLPKRQTFQNFILSGPGAQESGLNHL